ncbi:octopamine receptor-like [Branchiostoma lanceolatum]|uniref:octopamine receptor-like n=1 Tax=Branchiostoma lanceolatum TaxID=7740 RepID=UPI003451E5CD
MTWAGYSAMFPAENLSTFAQENDTFCTTRVYPYTYTQTIVVSTAVSAVILGIIIGNFFVCTSTLTQRKLRTVHNWFLVSLAIADLLVGVLIMPLALVNELLGYWYFGEVLCDLFLSTDIFVCTASILNLCGIAIDRYWAATTVANLDGNKEKRRAKIVITVVWFLAFLISVPPLLGWKNTDPWDPDCPQCRYNSDVGYVLFSISGSFAVPLVVITIAYAKVYLAVTRRLLKKRPSQKPAPAAKNVSKSTPAITVELATRSGEQCDKGNGKMELSVSFVAEGKSVWGTSNPDHSQASLRRSYSFDTVLILKAGIVSSPPPPKWFSSLGITDIKLDTQADTAINSHELVRLNDRSSSLNMKKEEFGDDEETQSSRTGSGSPPKSDSSPQELRHCNKYELVRLNDRPSSLNMKKEEFGDDEETQSSRTGSGSPPKSDSSPQELRHCNKYELVRLNDRPSSLNMKKEEFGDDEETQSSRTGSGSPPKSDSSPQELRHCNRYELVRLNDRPSSLNMKKEEFGHDEDTQSSRTGSGSQTKGDSSPQELHHCLKSDSQEEAPSAATDAPKKDRRQLTRRQKRRSAMAEMRGHLNTRERFLKKKERRLTLILGVVIMAFVVCWLPFFVTYVTMTVCKTCAVSDVVFKVFVWLGYCNSAVNPIIYTVFNKDFVAILGALRKVMCVRGACH